MKKIVSVILALSIMVLQFTALTLNVGAVANNGETILIDDDFESDKSWGDAGYIYSWVNAAERFDMGTTHKKVVKISRDTAGTNWVNAFGKSFDKAYTDGKVLISFDTFADSYSRYGDNNANNRSYMFLNFYQNIVKSYNDFATQVKRTPFAVDYKGALSNLGLGALDMTDRTNGIGNAVNMELKTWYHIDVLLEFGGSVKTYIDGVNVSEMNTPSDFTSFGAISFSGQLNGAGTDFRIDNLKAVHNPDLIKTEKDALVVNETEKYIDVKFTATLLKNQELTPENVFIKRCGSTMSEVSVSNVEIIDSKVLRIEYTGEFLPGREYKIITTEGVFDIFRNKVDLNETFNGGGVSVNKNSATVDFENTVDGTLPENFEEDKSWVGADIRYITSNDGYGVTLNKSGVTSGTHIYPVHKFSGINNKKGILTYSIDTYIDSKDTAPNVRAMLNGAFYLYTIASNTGAMTWNNVEKIATLPRDKWINLKFVFDYNENEIKYYFENELLKTVSFSDIAPYSGNSKFTGDFSELHFVTYIAKGQSATRYFDNLSVSYEEVAPTVKSVRYYDLSGNEFLGDQLDENSISKIKIAFNTPLNAETVNSDNITLKNSNGEVKNITGVYDEAENVYTMTVNNGETLELNPAYILTVDSSVSTPAGLNMSEDVSYYFAVGTAGITGITGYEKNYTVNFGSKFSQLPEKLTGLYAGGTTEVSVKWLEDGYYSKTPGTYVVSGEIIAPDGYVYSGENIKVNVTVLDDASEIKTVEKAEVRKNIGEVSPLATGTLSNTDTVQLGLKTDSISVVSDEFENPEAAFDSEAAKDTGVSTKTVGDGEIEIIFNESYDGSKTLDNIKLMFNKTADNKARWDIELLYKNSDGEWVVFFDDATDFKSMSYENGAYKNTNFTNKIYPTLIINNLSELKDVNGLKLRFSGLEGGYELYEADINMKNDGSVISEKRREIQNPIKFANIFADGAVIQRDDKITVWGYGGDNGDVIKVEIKDNSGKVIRSADAISDGRVWETVIAEGIQGSLDKYTITATDTSEESNKAVISDILFGDVFIASGQSNMGYGLGNIYNRLTTLGTDEAVAYRGEIVSMASENLEGLRFFDQSVNASSIDELEDTYTGKWYKNGSFHSSVHHASAVAYFFAYDLYKNKLNEQIPVAFVEAARGGSGIKAWMSEESYENLFGEITDFNRSHYSLGGLYTGCYNAIVSPLTKHNFKGVIWYQGEGDHASYKDYDEWFEALYKGWQKSFNDDELSFITVQLAAWDGGNTSKYFTDIRQTQMQIWQNNDEFVDMVTAIDAGENDGIISDQNDIHPLYKTPVGVRLSNVIARKLYGLDIESHGPLFDSVKKTDTGLEVIFTHADGLKLQSRSSEYKEDYSEDTVINCLEISKDGSVWETAANVTISDNKLIINCADDYSYVRYAWSDYPQNPNLYNEADLPAFPFTASIADERKLSLTCEDDAVRVAMPLTDSLKVSGKLFVAKYDKVNGALKTIALKDANFVLNDDNSYVFSMNVNEQTENVKAILVDNIQNMTPLTK